MPKKGQKKRVIAGGEHIGHLSYKKEKKPLGKEEKKDPYAESKRWGYQRGEKRCILEKKYMCRLNLEGEYHYKKGK